MSLAPEINFSLDDRARSQLEECGLTYSQLLRLLLHPTVSMPADDLGGLRLSGYGITALVRDGVVFDVKYDGADHTNWRDWALEAAQYQDGDVAGADDLVARLLAGERFRARTGRFSRPPTQRRPRPKPQVFPVEERRIPVAPKPEPIAVPVSEPVLVPVPVPAEPAPKAAKRSVLMSIHPSLRKQITRLVDGDFTRVVIHSPVKVEILPPSPN